MADGNGPALVVGGDSLVGAAIAARCRMLGVAVEVTSRRSPAGLFLDLGNPDFAPLERARYDVAFVCAAVTDMRACQADPERTRRINVTNTLDLMRRLASRGTHLLFVSSSQVFDGDTPDLAEDATTCPKNEYGAQKLAVEQAIAREELPATVLRVTKVLAPHPVGVFASWLKALAEGQPIEAATNMAISPVMVADVAEASERLAAGRHRGIWHLGARDELSYFEAARLLAEKQDLPAALVKGEALGEAQVPSIYRHRHATLSSDKIARALGMPLKRSPELFGALFAGFRQPLRQPQAAR
jgi:dTDP-4-dehydrorhamnose reductase